MTDGPFTEAKEAIVSFALVDARSKEEAIELARRFWQVARMEWIKLRTLRSTWWTVAIVVKGPRSI